MKLRFANYTKGQLKVQEMAFVLVAIIIFFALVAVLFITFAYSGLKGSAQQASDEQARQLVKTLAGSPEFKFDDCDSCVDKDKLFAVKQSGEYANFWNLDYLVIETVYPEKNGECTASKYPECGTITLVNKTDYFGVPSDAYVALCSERGGEKQCDLARVLASIGRTG